MRLLKFLSEQEEFEGCNKIKNFYAGTKFLRLFRGMKNAPDSGKLVPPTNREPRDSNKFFHDSMNNAFKVVFGKPLRSCSVFCTGDRSFAKEYGSLYRIYPSDDFEVYWSPKVVDLFLYGPEEWGYNTSEKLMANFIWGISSEKSPSKRYFDKWVSELPIPTAQEALNIVKTDCPVEYDKAIKNNKIDDWLNLARAVLAKYPNCMVNFVKDCYQKGDIKSAIRSENEIMLTCSFYYYKKSF